VPKSTGAAGIVVIIVLVDSLEETGEPHGVVVIVLTTTKVAIVGNKLLLPRQIIWTFGANLIHAVPTQIVGFAELVSAVGTDETATRLAAAAAVKVVDGSRLEMASWLLLVRRERQSG